MQSWAFSRNRNFNCIDCKNPVADAMGFFYVLMNPSMVKTPNEGAVLFLFIGSFICFG